MTWSNFLCWGNGNGGSSRDWEGILKEGLWFFLKKGEKKGGGGVGGIV